MDDFPNSRHPPSIVVRRIGVVILTANIPSGGVPWVQGNKSGVIDINSIFIPIPASAKHSYADMKIADHIRHSLEACDSRELDKAMLFACLAVDGTAKKMYPQIKHVSERFRKFIVEHLDIIELMHGGLNLQETLFPFKDNKGKIGLKFEDIIYEKFRCNLAHGDELPDGYGITIKVADGIQQFVIDIEHQAMTLPESAIYALGLPCVLAPVNAGQKIGNNGYHYRDPINHYVIDRWWGKLECARNIMDFESQVRVKMDFSNVWPSA